MPVEFDEPHDSSIDSIGTGSHRPRRWLFVVGAALIVAAIGVYAIVAPDPPTPADPEAHATRDLVHQLVAAAGGTSVQTISSSSRNECLTVQYGRSPADETQRALLTLLPGYRVRGFQQSIDQGAALCGFTISVRDSSGTVVLVRADPIWNALAPVERVSSDEGVDASDGRTVGYRIEGTDAGSVTVAWSGPSQRSPSPRVLEHIEHFAASKWR